MTDPLRVGLVGVGTIAETHLAVLAERPEVILEFTVDAHLAVPPPFRGASPPHYSDLGAAFGSHQPDLVVIATPTDTHAELTFQALTRSNARVLVEKPLTHDLDSLARLHAMHGQLDVRGRVFAAHHFAFSPEVSWAAGQVAAHPDWGPVTAVTSAFYDPYVLKGEQAFASYTSSWMDSGINQLSMLSRFVDLVKLASGQESDGGASAWCTAEYRSRGSVGTARLRSSWLTGASSKETVLVFGGSGVELWIDHTAMTGFAAQSSVLLDSFGTDGLTPRKVAHYRPLYESLLSGRPDPVIGFGVAEAVTELHLSMPTHRGGGSVQPPAA